MRHDKQNILVTRPLSGQQIEYARVLGLNPVIEPALEFEFPTYWDEVLKVINEHPKSDWVFTSRNGVKALKMIMDKGLQVPPRTLLFAVGSKTRDALKDLGLDAQIPRTQDSEHLADLILTEGNIGSVIYFHGNLSNGNMSDRLIDRGVEVIEIEVYKTIIKPISLPAEPVNAILFYSPSAVEGFDRGQGFGRELPVLFAIGPTTAEALKAKTNDIVEVADEPDTQVLLRTVADYLFKQENVK